MFSRGVLVLVGVSQIVLGALVLFAPAALTAVMKLPPPAPSDLYLLAMLGARFLAYGLGMFVLARARQPDRFWVLNMALIQAIDLAAGLYFTRTGAVALAGAAFPMINALLFCALLTWIGARRPAAA
jgi:hypothetical protein